MQVSSIALFHFPAGRCACSQGKVGSTLDCHRVNLLAKMNDHQTRRMDVNSLDYHVWGVMLEHYQTFYPKPKNTDGLKKVLQLII